MSDIKLFRFLDDQVNELEAQSASVEKSLQTLIERHMEGFLGVRFLASEYSTGKSHGGRIDSLGIDENGSPVIIEYKRALNENVINQGLYYLNWLLDHQGEFTLVVMKRYGEDVADSIEWRNARLLCIAGEFTKFDEHAVEQMDRNIELIRYSRYGEELLLLELVNAIEGKQESIRDTEVNKGKKQKSSTVTELLEKSGDELKDRFESLRAFIQALGDDVQMKTLRYYFAFKRLKNFACVEVRPQVNTLLVFVKVDPESVNLIEGFSRDVREIGHFGTGDLEITITSDEDLKQAQHLILRSYEKS